jgi:hypothetical protein
VDTDPKGDAMASKSKTSGWMIVKIGPKTGSGKLTRTVREVEEKGSCAHCNCYRKTLFSYADDNVHVCRRDCWVAYKLLQAGTRQPTKIQVKIHSQKLRSRATKMIKTDTNISDSHVGIIAVSNVVLLRRTGTS